MGGSSEGVPAATQREIPLGPSSRIGSPPKAMGRLSASMSCRLQYDHRVHCGVCRHSCPLAETFHGLSLASVYHPRHAAATIDTTTEGLQGAPQNRSFGTSAEASWRDRVALCEYAAVCVRARAPAMACPSTKSRTPRRVARPSDPRQIPRRSDTPAGRPSGEVSRVPMVASRRRRVCGCGRMDGP